MSERMRKLVTEEGERLGAMKRSDVESATRDFVTYIRELAEAGRIVINRQDETREP
jgi:flagellar motor switch protein FliG